MITEVIVGTGIAAIATCFQWNKEGQINEEAIRKYAKAFSREQEAKRLVEQNEKEADDSILKLARRKKAVVDTTINDFINVYETFLKINFQDGDGIKELTALTISNADISSLKAMSMSCSKPLSQKEWVAVVLFKGIIFGGGVGGADIKNAERNLSAANSQWRAANVTYSQAETIAVMYDAVKNRADRMADVLKKLNVLAVKSIAEVERLLSINGTKVKNYNDSDKRTIMNCVNFVKALKDILDVPLFNQNGELEEQAITAMQNAEAYMNQINQVI